MSDLTSDGARENLRVIRALMERATVYSAISAPTALFGGVLAILVSAGMLICLELRAQLLSPLVFVCVWVAALGLTGLFNLLLIQRDARSRNEPFLSSGMRMASQAIIPPLGAGGIVGITLALTETDVLGCALSWIVFYGLALLSTSGFSPAPLKKLGFKCLAFGLIFFVLIYGWFYPLSLIDATRYAALLMGLNFGVLHLSYGVSLLFRSRSRSSGKEPASGTQG